MQTKKLSRNNGKYKTVEKGIQYDNVSKKYLLTLYIGKDTNGKQVRNFETFTRIKDARKRKKEFEAQKRLNQAPQPLIKTKLSEYIAIYFNSLVGRSPSTIDGYSRICKRINRCSISKKYLQDIGKADIEFYIKYLRENTRMKAQTINKDLCFLSAVFDKAYKDELILRNPVKLVDKLRVVEKFSADFYNKDEIKKILTLIKGYPNKNVKLTFYLGLYLGLRRGEMVGLKWENIDFNNKKIKIINNRINVNGKVIEKTPKSQTSNRIIPLPQNLDFIECLNNVKQWQDSKFGGCAYLIVNPQTGKPICPQNLKRGLSLFCKKFNLREIRIHDLRHTFASISIGDGLPIKQVSTILGHGDTTITERIYYHIIDEEQNKTIETVGRIYDNLLNS